MKENLSDAKEHLEKLSKKEIRELLEKKSLEKLWDGLDEMENDAFEVKEEIQLAEGLSYKSLERGKTLEQLSEQETVKPSDYTSEGIYDASGKFFPGHVELEKLTDQTLEKISGDPIQDIPQWGMQSEKNSCAVMAQRFVINALTDQKLSEEELLQTARELGIYGELGSLMKDIGKLADAYGLAYEQSYQGTLEDIEAIHNAGGKVIACINGLKLQNPNLFGFFRADHAVQVVGIDRNDPEDVRVILNDPGQPKGAGLSVPADLFLKTWNTSNRFTVAIYPEVEKDEFR